jgi:hypothetical protein
MTEPKDAKPRDKTTNWAEYNAALKARGSLTIWLDKDMRGYAPASGRCGRQHIFSDAAIQFCLSIKCLFGLALCQSLGWVESLLRMAGLDWKVSDFSTVRRRQWRKVHLGIDANTLEIRAIEVSDNSVGDAPMLPELLDQTPLDETVASVSGDGANDTKASHRLGRSIWKKWGGYHRRSLAETKMHGFKRLGERVMARTFEPQVMELHVRVEPRNRFTQLGRPTTIPVATMA